MRFSQVGASTATGDTTKTSIGTITITSKARRIIGIIAHALGGAGNTTLENLTGILEIESSDLDVAPQQYILDCNSITGTGMAAISPRVWPADIVCAGKEILTGYITLDLAQTINPSARWGLLTEN